MNIHTKRLMLVPLGIQFLTSTHSFASDIDNTRYMVHLPNFDINETKSFLENVQTEWQSSCPKFYEFAILLEKKHIGGVCIYIDDDTGEGELGWIVDKNYWGLGYATEAAKEVMNFAMLELKISKFVAYCDSENRSSYRVMEKLGMCLENKTQGRRNKLSDEDREELKYSVTCE